MFTKIKIENFKSIKKADLNLNEINILIGPNNSGKSNLLEFIDFYRSLFSFEIKETFGPRPFSFRDVFCKGSDFRKNTIKGEFYYKNDKDFHLIHSFSIESRWNESVYYYEPGARSEKLEYNTKVESYTNKKELHLKTAYDKKSLDDSNLVDFVHNCKSIKRFQFSAKDIKKEREIDMTIERRDIPYLHYNGDNLVEVLYHIRDNSTSCYSQIIKDFQNIYPDITGISFRHLGEQKYGIEFTKKIPGAEWTFIGPQISDGMAISLAILTLINSPQPPNVILFEEIENGLNPYTLRVIFERIAYISNKKHIQFFITTHSPVLLELMSSSPEYVIVCEQKEGLSIFTPLNEILKKFGKDYEHGESLFHLWFNGLIGGL